MNDSEAIQMLEEEMAPFRAETYAELVRRISSGVFTTERSASSGGKYQIEIEFFWDGNPGGDVRVMGSVDDGGWRAFLPLNRSFIRSSDDSFVGE